MLKMLKFQLRAGSVSLRAVCALCALRHHAAAVDHQARVEGKPLPESADHVVPLTFNQNVF